ncbi:MAG: dTDP-glucose 4,6-dehydratase [Bdellovibrionales bacterium]|nr:dTDP-glucose 4,6-dehydratase [Bdellovibrionales bacterium]
MQVILVTGAAGFIGSAFIREAKALGARTVIYDALTYAGHKSNIQDCLEPGICDFIKGDIRDYDKVLQTSRDFRVTAIVNFAAESHVDNSIHGPKPFVETNVVGTFSLLEATRKYYSELSEQEKRDFRFLHVSTDEVFGELEDTGYFTERSPYQPNSPYSATKAASDHLVRAWHQTYKLPVIVTNCSNNYGPRQLPEKLVPRMITCALRGEPLPVYGKGANVRDWIHVEDHARGILLALQKGMVGETYCFGGRSERKNLEVVRRICSILDEVSPRGDGKKYDELITFVTDRAGHDWRYAIDDSKAEDELGFKRKYESFEDGLNQTVGWYIDNKKWTEAVMEQKK